MSALTLIDETTRYARLLEQREADRLGIPVREAREIVARSAGISPGTLENLRRGRAKGVSAWLRQRLAGLVCRALEQEMMRLENDLAAARLVAARPDDDRIRAAEAALLAAKTALKGG